MSLFKRLLFHKFKSEEKAKRAKESEHGKYYPEEKLPIDEKFTHYFNKNGGKFLYCENMQEVLGAFDNILIENDLKKYADVTSHLFNSQQYIIKNISINIADKVATNPLIADQNYGPTQFNKSAFTQFASANTGSNSNTNTALNQTRCSTGCIAAPDQGPTLVFL